MARCIPEYCQRFAMLSDEEVVLQARTGGEAATEYLLFKYRGLVESKARSYYLAGADHDDVVQEGMIGLYKAIRDFRTERLSRFRPFADLCVTRQIITAIKSATRQKHSLLNGSISLNQPLMDSDTEGCLVECIADERALDPLLSFIQQRERSARRELLQNLLSELEARVLLRYLQGKSYQEMSAELNCQTKSIDNALQRVKRKMLMLRPAGSLAVVHAMPQ